MSPVTATALTYKQLIDAKLKEYREGVPATALFHTNGLDWVGLRIECAAIRKEFCDEVHYGKDPEGTLFFDSLNDFPDGTAISYYNVFYSTAAGTEDKAAVVQFFTPGNQAIPYAEFVGKDPTNTVNFVVDGATFKRAGKWNDLNIATVTSVLAKATKSQEFELTIGAISKSVKWTLPVPDTLRSSIKAYGSISFKNIKSIANGTKTYIDYNNDRILFYTGADFLHGTDVVGYFIPEENCIADSTALGNYSFISPTAKDVATWQDI